MFGDRNVAVTVTDVTSGSNDHAPRAPPTPTVPAGSKL